MSSFILFIVFSLLSLLHLLWAFGMQWGLDGAYPLPESAQHGFKPGKILTLFVAICLALTGFFYYAAFSEMPISAPFSYIQYIIPPLFFIRGIGEFKYVGLFKRVQDTLFARRDTWLYTPLCFGIALVSLIHLIK